MQNYSPDQITEWVIYALVFLAVLLVVMVFLPSLFQTQPPPRKATDIRSQDDPMRHFIEPEQLQKMRYSYALVVAMVGGAVVIISGFYWGFVPVALAALAAYFLPKLYYQHKVKRRNQEFENGMLDFTVLVGNTLRAGVALPAAIEMVLPNTRGAVREEFALTLQEHRLGMDLVESLDRMNKRVVSENLQLFTVTVSVAMRTGGSMSDVLNSVVSIIRARSAFQERLQVILAQSNFEALMMSCAPLIAMVLLFVQNSQDALLLVTTRWGWLALGVVLLMEVVGYVCIKWLTEVKY